MAKGGASAPETKSEIPQGGVGLVGQRPTMPLQYQKPFAMQPMGQPSMAENLAMGGTQTRPNNPTAALAMLKGR